MTARLSDTGPPPLHDAPQLDGLCDPDAWWTQLAVVLAGALRRVGYAPEPAERLAGRVRARHIDGSIGWRVLRGAPHAPRRLAERGFRQVILSNHVPELALLVEQLGLARHLDAVVTSALTGYEKPHAGAYRAARTTLPPDTRPWMVGDSAEADCLGPERHGIQGVLLWPGTETAFQEA